jgi:microcystin degradation protein MlrC
MLKTFIACVGTETNTFSPMPTGWETFREGMLFHGDATAHTAQLFSEPLHVWRRCTEERQGVVVESVAAFAQPAGITVRPVYESLRDEMLTDLRAALPVDIVLLTMHGAMVADGYPDCEGDMLARVRELTGPDTVIGVELDLHCSISAQMTEHADVIITFKEYPHVDGAARAQELFDLCHAAHEGVVRPVMAVYDCKMINMWRTPVEPMKSVVAEMQAAEGTDGILSVSFAHGFPWGDVPDASAKMLVVADGDSALAKDTARGFGERLWSLRDETAQPVLGVDAALDRIEQASAGPVVLADVADNAGGGAPSDSTFMLKALIERGMRDVLSGYYWDPVAVRFCEEAGEGASLLLRVGGKSGPASGSPVDLQVTVQRIVHDAWQNFGTAVMTLGTGVWVTTDAGIDLVLNSKRTQVFHPNGFEQFGIDVSSYKGVVVKSTQHFYAGFAPLASQVHYVGAPGAIPPNFADIPYESFTQDYWPRVSDPHHG